MKLFCLLLFLNCFYGFSQTQDFKIKFKILEHTKVPAIAINITTQKNYLRVGTQTDLKGEAELLILSNSDSEVHIHNSSIKLLFDQPADSISINIKKGKIRYYFKGKKVSSKKFK
ncbi:hypothetical protein ACFPVY_07295 [Flavobacterium qiangtangense]|uniref:Auto-transporter adhesin head GIN domain-containing protein n=1 Tax=Flavobacterium qiangtangense TaxID=1442595 RepID=A0ABW1PMK9_9FLAO